MKPECAQAYHLAGCKACSLQRAFEISALFRVLTCFVEPCILLVRAVLSAHAPSCLNGCFLLALLASQHVVHANTLDTQFSHRASSSNDKMSCFVHVDVPV